ncbi:phospholipase D-like domain-containing protein [Nocardioides sp. LHG3406-4]|uniref:phospholipase D-like domain-containing protein n=1 Tax=Nocardioides sp. LHG3406-4 TaxID=2804575 RepID=UPI003CEF25F1
MKFRGITLLVVVLVFTALAAPAQAGRNWEPREGGHFNHPREALRKEVRIERTILETINHAKRGSRIRVSLFSWDRQRMAQALVRAKKRGVRVQVLLNNHQFTPAQRILKQGLGGGRWNKSFSYECHFGCRHYNRGENLHTKMFLFSALKSGATNVVFTGSFNLTENSVVNQWNDMFVRKNDPALFAGMDELWRMMRKDKRTKDPYWVKQAGEFLLQAMPFPSPTIKTDPEMAILNQIDCKTPPAPGYGRDGRTLVRVSMHSWADARGVYLANKMRELYAAGCDVQVMYGMAGVAVRKALAGRTARGYLPVHVDGYDTDYDGEIDLYSHQKYLAVSGTYEGNPANAGVWTGSSNWNFGGLRGDELIIRLPGRYFPQWLENFEYIWRNGSHLALYIPYRVPTGYGRMVTQTPVDEPQLKKGDAWEDD